HPATTHTPTLSLHDALPISLLAAAKDLGDVSLRADAERAARALSPMQQQGSTPGGAFFHARRPGEPPELSGLLADQAWVALAIRSEEHTSELQSPDHLVCRL